MRELGIKPEHECFDAGHVANLDPLIDMGLVDAPHQISLVMGVTGGIRPTSRNVGFMAEQIPGARTTAGSTAPEPRLRLRRANWQVIGVSRAQWHLLASSLVLGGNVRAGLEDNLYLPNGEMAKSNGELIGKARQMAEDIGRRVATVAEAREMLGVTGRAPTAADAKRSSRRAVVLPLSHVRILDLSRLLPGGFCSLLLADLGADVIKVEDTGMGDYVRWAPPYYGDDSHQALGTRSALYLSLNRGKRSARIDLKSEDGRKAFLKLAEGADVVLESFRPGVLDRSASGTRPCARSTRGSSTARSPATGSTVRTSPGPATTPTTSRSTDCSALPAPPTARR